jgi:cytoskeletal protein CcmA (bactofilin family)
MFGKGKDNTPDSDRVPEPVQQFQRLAVAQAGAPESVEAVSCISAGMTVVGKITGEGTLKVFGRIEGELHAPTVVVADGAHVEGDIVANDVTIGGRVKGTIHANRVKLDSTAAVEGDIFHRLLAIDENARFEGSSRREDRVDDAAPRVLANRGQSEPPPVTIESNRKLNGAPELRAAE